MATQRIRRLRQGAEVASAANVTVPPTNSKRVVAPGRGIASARQRTKADAATQAHLARSYLLPEAWICGG